MGMERGEFLTQGVRPIELMIQIVRSEQASMYNLDNESCRAELL